MSRKYFVVYEHPTLPTRQRMEVTRNLPIATIEDIESIEGTILRVRPELHRGGQVRVVDWRPFEPGLEAALDAIVAEALMPAPIEHAP
jgi:hypothetical protein